MGRVPLDMGLMPSLLDRMIDPEAGGTAFRPGYGPEQVMAVVKRDLEWLLNTRQAFYPSAVHYPDVMRSIVIYGLPDLSSLPAFTTQQRQDICRILETIIELFEPRLQEVRAHLIEEDGGKETILRYRVDARLRLDPAPDVAFETLLELTTGHYSIKDPSS